MQPLTALLEYVNLNMIDFQKPKKPAWSRPYQCETFVYKVYVDLFRAIYWRNAVAYKILWMQEAKLKGQTSIMRTFESANSITG